MVMAKDIPVLNGSNWFFRNDSEFVLDYDTSPYWKTVFFEIVHFFNNTGNVRITQECGDFMKLFRSGKAISIAYPVCVCVCV